MSYDAGEGASFPAPFSWALRAAGRTIRISRSLIRVSRDMATRMGETALEIA